MELVPLRAALALILALVVGGSAAAAPRAAAVSDDTWVEPPRITPEALLTALRRYVARVRIAGAGNDENGFGIVLAQRGDAVVIATAAHVVVDELGQPLGAISIVLDPAAGAPVEAVATLMPGQEPIDKAALDLAFLVARLPRPLAFGGGMAAPRPPRAGEPVWVVAPVVGAPWSPEPGKTEDIGRTDGIGFNGGGVQTGSSGSPLVSVNGVVGLVTNTNNVTSYAVPLATIRDAFIRRYVRDYDWRLPYAPVTPDLGWIRLSRSDDLTDFAVPFELMPAVAGAPPISAPAARWVPVPEGRYQLRAAVLGPRAELRCVPDAIEVRAFAQRQVDVACRGDFAGDWIGPSGRLRIVAVEADRYSVHELDPLGREVAAGTATLVGSTLDLAMEGPITGAWSARLTLEPGQLRGERRIAGTGAREDLTWTHMP